MTKAIGIIFLVLMSSLALADLEDYPVLDESDFSEREYEEANSVWESCYNVKERIEYVRENRCQFEFNGFADMLACIRGKPISMPQASQ